MGARCATADAGDRLTSTPAVREPLRLLYVVSRWRQPTETFVRREIDAAQAAGHEVVVVSLKQPFPSLPGDPEVVHLRLPTAVRHALVAAVHQPGRTLRVLARTARGARLGTIAPHAFATVVGLAVSTAVARAHWVHAHFAWLPATTADAIATVWGQPFGIMPHAFDIYEERVIDRLLGQKLRRAAVVVVESESIKRDVEQRFACRPTVLRMGVPAAYVRSDDLVGGRDPRLVVSVGALRPKKGHDVLLTALAHLGGQIRCVIVGEGPERSMLERLAASLSLTERVAFPGALDAEDVRDWLDRASVFVLASRVDASGDRDGVPNVLIEAMARGCPVVSTDVSGIRDLIGTDRGVVVPAEDPDALATAVDRVLSEAAYATALARAARDHVSEGYVAERNWDALENQVRAALRSPDNARR